MVEQADAQVEKFIYSEVLNGTIEMRERVKKAEEKYHILHKRYHKLKLEATRVSGLLSKLIPMVLQNADDSLGEAVRKETLTMASMLQ